MSTPIRRAVSSRLRSFTGAPRAPHCAQRSSILARPDCPIAQCSVPLRTNSHAMPVLDDQRLNLGGPVAKQFEQPLAIVGPKPRRDIVGRKPHAGVDQADVAPGAAEADLDRLQSDNLGSGLREMQRRREPGIAATDNRHIGPNLALERRGRRRRAGR